MLSLNELGRLAVDLGDGVDEVDCIELVAALVALVSASAVVATDGTRALDVAVREGAARGRRDGATSGLGNHVAVGVDGAEQFLRHRVVVSRGGAGEEVVGETKLREVLHDDAVVTVRKLLRRDAFPLRLHKDRRAVLIGARHHEDVVARHAHVAAEDVRRDAKARDMADVAGAVGIRPGNGRKDARHERHPIDAALHHRRRSGHGQYSPCFDLPPDTGPR